MEAHFNSFTAEWARAFGHELGAAADRRRLFVSELRSGVHALRDRFQLGLRQMANEFRATSEAFRNRPRAGAGLFGFEGQEGARRSGHSKRR